MKRSVQKSPKKHLKTRLLVSESERGADMLYATGFRAPDDFVLLESKGKKTLLLHDLELDRGRQEAAVDSVLSWNLFEKKVEEQLGRKPTYGETLAAFVKKEGSSPLVVPASFSLGLARALEAAGLVLEIQEGLFFPERAIKKPEEIMLLKRAMAITEKGMARGFEILKESTIGKKKELRWHGKPLTSERMREEIESTILRAGGIPAGDSIIAGGMQACDPHQRGHGVLYADQLIVLDLFPRDAKTGYYGDLTRTVVRGKASDAQRHLWETCLQGQKLALEKIKPGASGKKIHAAVERFFTDAGYPTEEKEGRWSGFFHGTGHGLGLELHEEPRFGAAILKTGNVFTIEPGLYIPGLGGVRHEDVIVVTPQGYQQLSRIRKPFEL